MAEYLVLNHKKNGVTVVVFNNLLVANYAIRLTTGTSRGKVTTAVSLPNMTWRHKDSEVAQDIIQGLVLAGKYIESIRGGRLSVRLSGGEAVYNDGDITAKVFPRHDFPRVTLVKEPDGFYRWRIDGYYSGENDSASLLRIAGTINNVRLKAEEVLK